MSEETHTLVIYELLPEEVRVYLVPDSQIPAEVQGWLKQSHGVFVNSMGHEPNKGTDFVSLAALAPKYKDDPTLGDDPELCPKWNSWLDPYLVQDFADVAISNYIRTGFVL